MIQNMKREEGKTALDIQSKIGERQRYAADKDRCGVENPKDVTPSLCVETEIERWL